MGSMGSMELINFQRRVISFSKEFMEPNNQKFKHHL